MPENKRIVHVLIAICFLFFSLVAYLTYFELFTKGRIVTNSYNRRQWEREDNVLRGSIFDRNGVVLAKSVRVKNKQERVYPYGDLYAHSIGYNTRVYGRTLVESAYNEYLLDISRLSSVFGMKSRLSDSEKYGNNIYLSLHHKLQLYAKKMMSGRNGAVVAMNPKTGEVLAMVSNPSFDPDTKKLSEKWQELVESQISPFLPRATMGLYTAGSTFKLIISAAALENGLESRTYDDKGSITIDGKKFSNSGGKAYGRINMEKALAVSSNVVFSQLGVELGERKLRDITKRFGIRQDIPFDIPVNESRFSYDNMGKADMAAVGIGQGKVLVTPLHMAMITACIANNGVMMKPMLVTRIESHQAKEVKSIRPAVFADRVISRENAYKVRQMMREVVLNGTGKSAAIKGINVAGKTGTAENELTGKQDNKEHTWFVGFAPAEDPQIAVAVILEYSGGTGGRTAAPIAREVMKQWLGRQTN
ncbi:MAG: penicillin-binding transpeptidase domain-containing protein [Clostridia bacterium]|nr:penicillin-binding transpeptidase domain-containing protein [Clostridia bacterium]